jgi:hypothetical protein
MDINIIYHNLCEKNGRKNGSHGARGMTWKACLEGDRLEGECMRV